MRQKERSSGHECFFAKYYCWLSLMGILESFRDFFICWNYNVEIKPFLNIFDVFFFFIIFIKYQHWPSKFLKQYSRDPLPKILDLDSHWIHDMPIIIHNQLQAFIRYLEDLP